MKSKKELYAEMLYNKVLKEIVEPLTGDNTTYLSELHGIGRKLLRVKFKGVFPADLIPRLNDLSPYAILNLDNSKQPGSHWVAIAKHDNDTYLYDSFGRKDTQIIKNLEFSGNGRIINSDTSDREQEITEMNCGARSLAWLCIFDRWGPDVARLI